MDIPNRVAGQRVACRMPPPDADALWLASLTQQEHQAGRLVLVVCADAADCQRLKDGLQFFSPATRVAILPDWETLPYDHFSPHQDLISERLATLWQVHQRAHQSEPVQVVLVSASAVQHRLAPPAFLAGYTFAFATGQKLAESALREQLVTAGYRHVTQVVSPGEYAVRGGIIDLFPMGAAMPLRLDLFDDEIDTIRTFDPDTQRSLYPVPSVHLLPGREFPMDEAAQAMFRQRWREHMDGDPTKSRVYKDMGHGVAAAGVEYYLPLFFESTASLLDYTGEATTLVLHGDVDGAMQRFWQDTQDRYQLLRSDPDRPALPPLALFFNSEAFFVQAKPLAQVALRPALEAPQQAVSAEFPALPELGVLRDHDQPWQKLQHFVKAHNTRVLVVAESHGRSESLADHLRGGGVNVQAFDDLHAFCQADASIGLCVGQLSRGLWWQARGLALLTESELFGLPPGQRRARRQEQASDIDALIKDLSELNPGDPVVHSSHGIGRYRGLVNLEVGRTTEGDVAMQEFLHLEYAQQATLYVPVSQLHLIARYTGVAADEAPLHKLGSGQWDKARRKAAEQVRDTAAELLNLYALRQSRQGHAFRYQPADYERFANDFGFEETADQRAAIHAVVQDMISPRPMDRLVCGDVGFGKTEVALRAAFVAVMGGKQVALLAPTTLLAEQHHQTLSDRFARWPVKVAELSRFRSAKEAQATLKALADGTVDIVVGTHKLIGGTASFKRLGLLIIDEEHRFGVRHKEALKAMRAEVDVLTLTATPIPRTMGMALEGLRDLSVIATAPQRRLAIKTFVRSEGKGVIREAVMRELQRGGQVYFLHNEVKSIEHRADELRALIPEARLAVAHGQMPERQLEQVMRDFVAQRHNVLLCSTIIETGIDVPSANTIVIARADKFGLAQLHQLRGRVGRSHHQAYAYLMVPDIESLTRAAQQRLDAIQQMEELGSGFYLAMHDLEIRGAGEVLGENQSGNMLEVGFQMYNDMLGEAVAALKAGREPDLLRPLDAITDINLHTPALLPDDYCGDVHTRLSFYKKLATARALPQLDRLREELADRFGKLPAAALMLFEVHRLRVLSEPFGIVKVDAAPGVVQIVFKPHAPVDPAAVLRLVQTQREIRLAGNDKLRIERDCPEPLQRAQLVRDIIRQLGQPLAQPTEPVT